jgi:hypothetical protein
MQRSAFKYKITLSTRKYKIYTSKYVRSKFTKHRVKTEMTNNLNYAQNNYSKRDKRRGNLKLQITNTNYTTNAVTITLMNLLDIQISYPSGAPEFNPGF